MRPRDLLCLAVALTLTLPAHAVNKSGSNWYFGTHGGVTFINGAPEPLAGGQLSTTEGCATISDTDGGLLFYTDGISIWNRNHQLMPHGTGLKGNSSATQSAVIVPHPGDSDLFYVFAVPANSVDGLTYSIVDMTLDGGNGDVDTNTKNVKIIETSTEQVTAVGAAGNDGYWVVGRPGNNNAFHAFRITAGGINTTPVISSVGTSMPTAAIGYLKASSDGSRLATASYFTHFAEVYDFDNATGTVSNAVHLGTVTSGYGVEFSPNNNLLYVTSFSGSAVYQYDLTAGDIGASRVQVGTVSNPAALQLGPDQKIYLAVFGGSTLGVINSPDTQGTGCNFQSSGVAISGSCQAGLPTFIQSFFSPTSPPTVTTTAISGINMTGATGGGEVTDEGGLSVTARGVCWNTYGSPTTAHSHTSDGSGLGAFTSTMTGLNAATTYYVRAYATNTAGTSYGTEVSFTTASEADSDGDSVPDSTDGCPNDPSKIAAGLCGCGTADTDTDGDETPDCNDGCPNDINKTAAGTCGCGVAETDTDEDGTPDCNDGCPGDANKTAAGVCGCGTADTDTDGDGTPDCNDGCPNDAQKTTAGTCGCGTAETDTDSDGTPDCNDGCPENPALIAPGANGCSSETPAPDLHLVIESNVQDPNVGQEVPFLVTVSNLGTGDANETIVTIPLPPNTEFVSASIINGAAGQETPDEVEVVDGVIRIHLGTVTPSEQIVVELVLRALTSGQMLVTANAESQETPEPVTGFNEVVLSVNDEYVRIVRTVGPLPCGAAGIMPMLSLAFLLGAWSRSARRGQR